MAQLIIGILSCLECGSRTALLLSGECWLSNAWQGFIVAATTL